MTISSTDRPLYTTRTGCRACGSALDTVLDLGELRLSGFPESSEIQPPKAPLDLAWCAECGLVQLRQTVDPDLLYRKYWYRSSVNETMVAELQDIVKKATRDYVKLRKEDIVMDIGANDGTLLRTYPVEVTRIAFEPALNFSAELRGACDLLVADYFPKGLGHLLDIDGKVKILTSIACFYDLDDPHSFVEGVARVLHPDGVWVVQFQDLLGMLESTAWDNIGHEHLAYYSLTAFDRLIASHGLRVVDLEWRAINGGSLRLVVQRAWVTPRSRRPSVQRLKEVVLTRERLAAFATAVEEHSERLCETLEHLRMSGQAIDIYGASTKANTLLQYCGLGPATIRQAVERDKEKWGRMTVTGVPIVSEEQWRKDPAPVTLVGIWQFREAVLKREKEYLMAGGSFIFPLPKVEAVG